MFADDAGMIHALLDGCGDADDAVRSAVLSSLVTLGKHSPALVLNSTHAYLARQTKVQSGILILLMCFMCVLVLVNPDLLQLFVICSKKPPPVLI